MALILPCATQAQSLLDYTFSTGTDATAWVTLSSSATEVSSIYDDDQGSSLINIGFTFQFGGTDYTQWSCNSNGRVRLGSTAVSNYWVNPFTTSSLTNTSYGSDLPLLAAFGMDNTLAGSGVWVKYEVVGTAPNRMLVIEYRTPSEYDEDGDLVNYQIQLEETTNKVRFVYGTTAASYYDGFQSGMASSTSEVVTVTSSHTVAYGPTTTTRSSWPGVNRYYEFTPVIVTCPRPSDLTLSNVTSDAATLSWTPGGTESSWLLSDGTNTYTALDTFYTFTGLSPMTDYTLSVRALCSASDTSGTQTIACHTLCGLITSLPYSNDFENEPDYSTTSYAEAFPNCWTRINDATSTYNYYPYITTSSSYVHSGVKGMYWYLYTSTTYADNMYAVLPGIDTSVYNISDLTLAFYAKTTSTSYHPAPIVGVMTNPNDASTFTPVHTFSSSDITTTWTLFSTSFSNYTGSGNFIAIKCPRPSSTAYMAVDDIFLTDEWCDIPVSVSATSGLDEITVSWTATSGSSFTVIIGNDTIPNVTGNSYTYTGLASNTLYNYAVAVECASSSSMFIGGSIRTLCDATDSLPITMGFETSDGVPSTGSSTSDVFVNCWHRLNNGSQYFGYPYVGGSTYAHTGSRGLYWFNSTTTGTYGDYQIIVLPGVDTAMYPLQDLRLSFWAKASSTSYSPVFLVGVMTDPSNPNTFQQVATVNVGNSTVWQKYNANFSNYTGAGTFVAIRANRGSSSWYAYVDDIMLGVAPDCPEVSGINVSNPSHSSADLNWTENGNASSWTVEYGTHGFTPGNGTIETATALPYTLSSLNANTEYDVYITPECSGTAATEMYSFRTGCAPLDTLPYTMGFEASEGVSTGGSSSATFVNCMRRLNNGTSYFGYPYVSSSSSYNHTPGGSRGLYWYNTTTTGTYGDYQIVVLPAVDTSVISLTSLQLTFWARATGTSYHPSFQVGVMTDPTNPSSFQQVATVNVEGTDFQEFTTSLGSYTGNGTFVAIRALRPTSSWYANVDDITLDHLPSCPPITNLTAETVTPGGAVLSWNYMPGTDDTPVGFELVYDSVNGASPVTTSTTDLFYSISGLTEGTEYKVYVRANCGSGYGSWDSISFSTGLPGCLVADTSLFDTVSIGNSTSTSNYLPSYSTYNYGLSQQIYTAAEIGGSKQITALAVMPQAITQQRTFEIYLAHTSATSLSGFIHPSDMVKVYDGAPVTLTANQWINFNFNRAFNYNGSDNLLVCFRDLTGAWVSGNYWYAHSISGNSVYIYRDDSSYDPFT